MPQHLILVDAGTTMARYLSSPGTGLNRTILEARAYRFSLDAAEAEVVNLKAAHPDHTFQVV